jgi:hypothetical protein
MQNLCASTNTVKQKIRNYAEYFNSIDDETIKNEIENSEVADWMIKNVPHFECPDKEIERTYYYRWWVYRKHIKNTEDGYIITEFLPQVGHSKKHNSIVCASGLHIDEGRWLKNKTYIEDYIHFWFSKHGKPKSYSTWLVNSIFEYCKTIGDFKIAINLLPKFIKNFNAWEKTNMHQSGLFWSYDDRDGGEYSISGSGLRPTLNSYMYADAKAIASIANLIGNKKIENNYITKANELKTKFDILVWDNEMQFFVNLHLHKKTHTLATYSHNEIPNNKRVRELYGLFPWKFNMPSPEHSIAWEQILNKDGFYAKYGLTTAEQRHPRFMKNRIKRCQWDGSVWPFATSITLGGMKNLLQNYQQNYVSNNDFYQQIKIYTNSQQRKLPYGEKIPWIGESLHPYSGIWLSRAIALELKIPKVKKRRFKDKSHAVERGKDYNHSSYCDLIISGLIGLSFSLDGHLILKPLLPQSKWNYFHLDNIYYKGKKLTIKYDKTGNKYGTKGLQIHYNGNLIFKNNNITNLEMKL